MVHLRDICKIYNKGSNNQVDALKHVDLDIFAGDFVAITGPSGSGKSTLLHILSGLDNPSSGTFTFKGQDVVKMSDAKKCQLRNKDIAIILQTFGLIGTETVLHNVCLPHLIAGTYSKKVEANGIELLKQLGLGDKLKKPANQLSGGQCQRVAIVRALSMGADLILADEPTGALDSENTDAMMDLFTALNQNGITIVIVTHDQKVVARCPIVYSIVDGVLERVR